MGLSPHRRAVLSVVAGITGVTLVALAVRAPAAPFERAAPWIRRHAHARDLVVVSGCTRPEDVDLFAPVPALCSEAPSSDRLGRAARIFAVDPGPTLSAWLGARLGAPRDVATGVRRYPVPNVLVDLRQSLARARVTRGGAPCPARAGRHVCPGAGWRTVEPRELEVTGVRIPCVFAHPSEDGLSIELDAPPLAAIRGVAGLSDRAVQRRDGPAVEVRLAIGERTVGRASVPNRRGLVSLSAEPRGAEGPLTIEVAAPSQGARSFCLALWGLGTTGSDPHR